MAVPIWKDTYVDFGTASSVAFEVHLDSSSGTLIYYGTAVKRPGASTNSIRINDICAAYLSHTFPTMASGTVTSLDVQTFVVTYSSSSTTVEFINDWSYDYDINYASTTGVYLNAPINGHIQRNQLLPLSVFGRTSYVLNYITASGVSTTSASGGPGTLAFALSGSTSYTGIQTNPNYGANQATWYFVDSCNQYALYYVNAYGGWDEFLIEGNKAEQDTLTRYFREVEYDNTSVENASRQNYANEITKQVTFHTGYLTDDEASRMHHLLNSPAIYICDITEGTYVPATITNTTTEYKTKASNGGRPVNYAITLDISHNYIRR